MTSMSDDTDLDPTTDYQDLVEEWSEAIVQFLGPEGYLLLMLFYGGLAGFAASRGDVSTATYTTAMAILTGVGFVRVYRSFEYGLRRSIFCERLHWHRGHIKSFDGGRITTLECSRCGRFCHPVVHAPPSSEDHPFANEIGDETREALRDNDE